MKEKTRALAGLVLIAVLATAGWIAFLEVAADELPGMAIIEDTNGDRIAVEPTSGDVWDALVELNQSAGEMWVGGVVEVFLLFRPDPDYPWGFRFNPDSVTVAEGTAEGLQTTIRDISEDVDYWIGIGQAYVFAKVVELRARAPLGDVTFDGTVDILDAVTIALAFGATPSDPNWNLNANINGDLIVDLFDLAIVALHFGEAA
jgi:hypothetical protein